MRKTKFLALVVCVAAIGLFAGKAAADMDLTPPHGWYTHDASCTGWGLQSSWIDPINYIFFSWGTIARVENQVQTHGFQHDQSYINHDGTQQSFISHNACYPQDLQLADHPATYNRNHFRAKAYHSDPGLGYTMTADAHHDVVVLCGLPSHAVDPNNGNNSGGGFNLGRSNLTNGVFTGTAHMSGSYLSWFGNTYKMPQCNGWIAWSDGYVRMMPMHQVNHT